mgnify:CR=1 FL=1
MSKVSQEGIRCIHREVVAEMLRIRHATPNDPVPAHQAKGSVVSEGRFWGRPARRVIVHMRSSGCEWVVAGSTGRLRLRAGCLDCEHCLAGTTRGVPIPAETCVRQFQDEIAKHDFSRAPVLGLFNEGSFFNERELPVEARRAILSIVGAHPHIAGLSVESLPRFITPEVLSETHQLVSGKHVEIGVGLDSSDPVVRRLCINKPGTVRRFEAAVRLVNTMFHSLAYVLVKPSFLTEVEALEDACQSVRDAFRAGVSAVSIEPIAIGNYSMAAALREVGLYRCTWLWTLVEIVRRTHALGEVRVGGENFAPRYLEGAHNCPACNDQVASALRLFDSTQNVGALDSLDCGCREQWRGELLLEHPPLTERIVTALGRIRSGCPTPR